MEEELRNLSNNSHVTTCQAMPNPGMTAFVIVLSIAFVAVILLNGLIAIMLLRATSVAIQVRVLLVNLLVAILIVAVVWVCTVLYSVALALGYASEPSLPFCHFGLWVYGFTAQARILGLMLFSTMVLQTVTCGITEIGAKWLICSLAPCWVITFLISFRVLIPEIIGVQYVGCTACFPGHLVGAYQVIGTIQIWYLFVIGCTLPLLVCICTPLATLCYIKRHNITEGAQYSSIAKFAAFLVPGSFLTVLGHVVTVIVGALSTDIVGVYVGYSIACVSYIPTPILIVVFLKPVRKQLRHLFCRKCQKDNEAIPMQQAETPINPAI